MAAPLNLEEGQSSTRPPRFNGHFYSWWKVRMHDYLMAEDSELWDIVLDGPFIPIMEEKDGEKTSLVPKPRQKYDEADRKKIEKDYKAKTLLVCGIGPDEFNRVSACKSAKEFWDCLKTAHEGTEQSRNQRLACLPQEAKDLKVLTMDALIGNLKTHEMNRNYDLSKKEDKKDKSLMLKYKSDEDSNDDDMTYLISRFQKIVRKNKVYKRGTNGNRNVTQGDTCYKCGKAGHFIRECPLLKNENKEHQKPRSDKENRRDLVLGKRDRKAVEDLVVKKALAAWGDSSSDSEDSDEPKDVSMVAVHEEETVFNEMFALMAHTENEEEDNQLRTLAKVMIDFVIELTFERDTMNAELDSLNEKTLKLEEKMSRMVSLESNNSELKN
ncbi:uncharacterized protein [Solanum lycopersicum]|uniref:uncharacterized protein n=1 Tax=Solanum lycopersicum TaxID=4081 RepID=UPI003747A754